MAVAFDAAANGTGTGTSFTIAHTIAGSDRVVYVGVTIDAGSDFAPAVASDLDGSFGATLGEVFTGGRFLSIFRKIAPSTGAHTLTVSSLPGGGQQHAISMSFTGVDQSTPNDALSMLAATSVNVSQDISSASGDMVIDWVSLNGNNGGSGPVVDASQTQPANAAVNNAGLSLGASYEAGAATVTMSWTFSNVVNSHTAFNLNATGGGGGSTNWGPLLAMRHNRRVQA